MRPKVTTTMPPGQEGINVPAGRFPLGLGQYGAEQERQQQLLPRGQRQADLFITFL